MKNIVAPSLLSCDFSRIKEESVHLNQSAAQWFHLDVMDGVFVPNISFGLPIIEAFRRHTSKVLDVHAMIANPDPFINDFKSAGADILTVHYEACTHLHRTIDAIGDVDMVLIMSVNPGFGGQKFIEHTYDKVRTLKKLMLENSSKAIIEVDGGVNLENAPRLVEAGVNALVAGSTVYKSEDPLKTIEALGNA